MMANRKPVKWAELFPHQFKERIEQAPVVYLPMGLCEPHGHVAVLGLDTLKAEYLCSEAASRWGGIVAPTQGYQIHEVGFHAPWLAEVVGNITPYMTSIPTGPMLYFFLYQMRAFHNAGFKMAIIISGHSGGNQNDFRLASEVFMEESDMEINVFSDPELTNGQFEGDHAGKYEVSQLLYLYPEYVNLNNISRWVKEDPESRFAQGVDAQDATAELGKVIMEKCLSGIHNILKDNKKLSAKSVNKIMTYKTVENIWQRLRARYSEWVTPHIKADQSATPDNSIWKAFENYQLE